jgi:hypothetical protein
MALISTWRSNLQAIFSQVTMVYAIAKIAASAALQMRCMESAFAGVSCHRSTPICKA